jgi:hypothetical protein
MKDKKLLKRKKTKITDPLGIMHRISEVERVNDGPFLIDL